MNRMSFLILFVFVAASAFAQSPSTTPDPYKPVLDRLQSITVIPLETWQAHAADLPHGEYPALGTSDWQPVKLKEDWKGSRWLRLTSEVPAQLNGYSLHGARISLDLHVSSDDAIQISIFSNGNMVARTDEDGQVPITLIENARPGQILVLAVRVLDSGGGGCCGGEEAEIAGVYVIDDEGNPHRIGMTQGNEFSDHKFEKRNYLNLAGSKLRTCSVGPELVIGPDFTDVRGEVRIERGGETVWHRKIASGEENMCHSLANMEHHHFKFAGHRQPGNMHVHYFGADALSCGDGVVLRDGDVAVVRF